MIYTPLKTRCIVVIFTLFVVLVVVVVAGENTGRRTVVFL